RQGDVGPTADASVVLNGGKHSDVLKGGSGNDHLNGRLGLDKLTGGGGSDVFAFTTKLGPANVDKVLDFDAAFDTLRLSKAVFKTLHKGPLDKGAFRIGAQALDDDDRILYNIKTGVLSYDADGDGTAFTAIKFAQLKAKTALSADDFLIG
ncbi:calcium-binding protein, partial [Corallococcus exiguus]